MLNYLWGVMIIVGIVYACITGNLAAISDGALDAAKEAVDLCITMVGVMSVWTGLMRIAGDCGLIGKCSRGIGPLMHWIFPDVPAESKAMEHMTTNVIANFLGLGWAATPAGIKAMEELGKLSHMKERASNAMCAFLVINISSIQLIPITIIGYRSQYGSASPTAIVMPAIAATTVSTLAGIIFCRIMYKKH
ncbi:MAG: nucleoside recognition domain-containing protein [Eubacteriales bacterium]|nr:nucleoside recognition domain-containing protein [Eubacteriales bacterium]